MIRAHGRRPEPAPQGHAVVRAVLRRTTLPSCVLTLADQARYVLRVENRVTDSPALRRTTRPRTASEPGIGSPGDPLIAFAWPPREVDPRNFSSSRPATSRPRTRHFLTSTAWTRPNTPAGVERTSPRRLQRPGARPWRPSSQPPAQRHPRGPQAAANLTLSTNPQRPVNGILNTSSSTSSSASRCPVGTLPARSLLKGRR